MIYSIYVYTWMYRWLYIWLPIPYTYALPLSLSQPYPEAGNVYAFNLPGRAGFLTQVRAWSLHPIKKWNQQWNKEISRRTILHPRIHKPTRTATHLHLPIQPTAIKHIRSRCCPSTIPPRNTKSDPSRATWSRKTCRNSAWGRRWDRIMAWFVGPREWILSVIMFTDSIKAFACWCTYTLFAASKYTVFSIRIYTAFIPPKPPFEFIVSMSSSKLASSPRLMEVMGGYSDRYVLASRCMWAGWSCEWMSEWASKWVLGWVSEWVSEWVLGWVSE